MITKNTNLVELSPFELKKVNGGDAGLFFIGLIIGVIAAIANRAKKSQV
ncbi:MAG: hypothetical protein Q4C98_10605 [Capnocytophaga sp.]|nr:hypothetical protein [Capnocytophaga sp.]